MNSPALVAIAEPRHAWRIDARALAASFIALAVLILAAVHTYCYPKAGELEVYLTAAERMAAGQAIYRTEEPNAFCYPPFFALLFVPLTRLPAPAANFVWNVTNLSLLAYIIATLDQLLPARKASGSWRWTPTRYLVLGLLVARFLLSPLEYRSHDFMWFALLVGALHASVAGRETWVGLGCGLAAACKATPLLFLPMLLLRGRWRAAMFFGVACAGGTFLPDAVCPTTSGELWSAQWHRTFLSKVQSSGPAAGLRAWRAWNHLNQGLAGTVYRLTTPPPSDSAERVALQVTLVPLEHAQRQGLTLLLLGSVFVTTLAGVAYWRPASHLWREVGTWSVLLAAMLLLSPMSSKQHFCTLLLPLAYVLDDAFDHPQRRRWLLPGLAAVFVLGSCLVKDVVGRPLGNHALAAGSLTWCALIVWLLAMRLLRTTSREKSC